MRRGIDRAIANAPSNRCQLLQAVGSSKRSKFCFCLTNYVKSYDLAFPDLVKYRQKVVSLDLVELGVPLPAALATGSPAGYICEHDKSQHMVDRDLDAGLHELPCNGNCH